MGFMSMVSSAAKGAVGAVADVAKATVGVIQDVGGKLANLSPAAMAQAMKDALIEGIIYAIEQGSKPGYFSEREDIKIRFPEPLENHKIEGKIRALGQNETIDQFLIDLNYAAEQSTGVCKDIFEEQVKGMNISKCKDLLLSKNKRAITEYLEETCGDDIRAACRAPIDEVCDKITGLKVWETLKSVYNAIPLVKDIQYDVREHVTEQTVNGILLLIAEKEVDIRENPMSFAKESIQGVFGAAKDAFEDYTQRTGEMKAQFKELDTNGDGTLDLEELKELLTGGGKMKDKDVKALFRNVDANKDGKVDIDEFVDWIHEQ